MEIKRLSLPKPTSFSFLKVEAEAYPVSLKVYGDGSVIYHATISTSGNAFSVTGTTPSFCATDITDTVVRLPANLNKVYGFEVISSNIVNEVCLAESVEELKGV
mgnify:CR=1 FL=1